MKTRIIKESEIDSLDPELFLLAQCIGTDDVLVRTGADIAEGKPLSVALSEAIENYSWDAIEMILIENGLPVKLQVNWDV